MNKNINDRYWMDIVDHVAKASTCRKQLGCVLVRNNYIVGIGYNGSVSGDSHCNDTESGCLFVDTDRQGTEPDKKRTCIRTVHAEMNAILKCTARGSYREGWITCYASFSPCLYCFKCLLSIGVRKIIYGKPYKDLNRDLYIQNLDNNILKDLVIKHSVFE